MRRGILVVALVTVAILLVMVAPAFANTGTKNGGYWPYSTTNNNFYALDGTVIASPTVSPHGGYSNTTGKCKVCHAVHGAGSTDVTGTTLNPSEVLLRSTKANACEFCHLTNTFAMDPYYNPTFGTTPVQNYHSNGGGFTAVGSLNSWWKVASNDASATQYTLPASGHNAAHSHAIGQGYQGCPSCHSVHGANTIGTSAEFILKNDPAKGVTSLMGTGTFGNVAPFTSTGWTDASNPAGVGYGSISAPVTSQVQFCQDCHDGTQSVAYSGTKTPIVSQAQFETYFPSCGGSNLPDGTAGNSGHGIGCHDSVSTTITRNNTQFGITYNPGHNGRSHIMTTNFNGGIAKVGTDQSGSDPVQAGSNGCQTCHNVPIWNGIDMQADTFPHFATGNELIPAMSSLTAIDNVCLSCHDINSTTGVGKSY